MTGDIQNFAWYTLVVKVPFGDQSLTQLHAQLFSSDRPLSTLHFGQKCLCQMEVEWREGWRAGGVGEEGDNMNYK